GPRFRFTSRWLARWGWAVGIAALLLAFLTFLALRPAQNEPAGSSHRPAAYAVIQDGSAKIIRGSQEVPASQVEALEPLDELVLPPGARATLVLAGGIATLNGPWRGVISSAALTQKAPDSGASADRLKLALFEEPHELRGAGLLASTRSGSTLRIFSPAGVTAWVNPLIIWDSQPGKSYEVTVTDAFDSTAQPVSASAVFSPLEFTQIPGAQDWPLRPGGLYRIRVQESGNPFILAERTFQVADPGSLRPTQVGVAQLLLAHEILAGAPARVGDAMAELLTIPNNLARTPLAVRLKLLAFGQLGDAEGFAAMLALLQAEE